MLKNLIWVAVLLTGCKVDTSVGEPAIAGRYFNAADCSQDARLTPAESRTVGLIVNGSVHQVSDADFNQADTDKNGKLDGAEAFILITNLKATDIAPAGAICPSP